MKSVVATALAWVLVMVLEMAILMDHLSLDKVPVIAVEYLL